jgi:hypothetical protein
LLGPISPAEAGPATQVDTPQASADELEIGVLPADLLIFEAQVVLGATANKDKWQGKYPPCQGFAGTALHVQMDAALGATRLEEQVSGPVTHAADSG